MGYCKDCIYWGVEYEGVCDKVGWVGEDDILNSNAFGVYADASDDTGLVAQFKTGPLFGCVRFMEDE